MFGKGKSQTEAGVTLIAHNCELTGDICFSDQLLVNGVIKGNVFAREGSKAMVTVSEKGQVKGDIRVPDVIVNGKVDGDIYSTRHIELAAKAEVKGNVYYNLIEMVMGSAVDGNLVHVEEEEKQAEAPLGQPAETKQESPEVSDNSQLTSFQGNAG